MNLPDREQFGLWLSLSRQMIRQSAPIAVGIATAFGKELTAEFFANFTDSADEAKLLEFRAKRKSHV